MEDSTMWASDYKGKKALNRILGIPFKLFGHQLTNPDSLNNPLVSKSGLFMTGGDINVAILL